jgi:CRP/FNR family transcriptional regulator
MLDQNNTILLKNSLTFWDKITENQQTFLLENSFHTKYRKKDTLNSGDQDCYGVIIVKSGNLRVYMLSDEGKEITLFRLDAGEVCILSSSCVLNTLSFDVHLCAESDCDLIHVSAPAFQKVVSNNIYAECFTYKLATERFSLVMWTMEQILFTSFDKRLAGFLLDESISTKSDVISHTHEEIAHYLGSAREVVSRMLKYFAKEGYVELKRGTVTILDKKSLRDMIR